MTELKLGSLFDGIGGFPLAATMNDIRPVWASEIEPFPMAVTAYRFPQMKHMGDITKLHGANLPVVDVIAGGSPCQDLSVAGKREGLAGERSGLFMEQVRIVKEMRKQDRRRMRNHRRRTDEFIRPRYMLWENVPGAFSSGTPKGEDFRIVLEEIHETRKRLHGHQLHIVMALLKVYDGTCGCEIESPRHPRKKTPVSLLI